ncbi:MAG: sulfite exporter TauE/SafE family protein [Actinobacteria bacterium]|nr:sulfite exporter TauE/SafE family protein [Actinomycetota bacterium]
MPIETIDLVIGFVVTFLAAVVQGTIGMGFAIVSVPLLSIIDPRLAPVPQLLVSIPLTTVMAFRERQHIDFKGLSWILAGRIPGALLGLALLKAASESTISLLIAGSVLIAVGALASGIALTRSRSVDFATGAFAGTSALVSSIGGPPMALLFQREKAATVRASLGALFTVGLLITLVTRMAAGEITGLDVKVAAVLLPGMGLGFWTSTRISGRLDESKIRPAILILSALAAVALVVRTAIA